MRQDRKETKMSIMVRVLLDVGTLVLRYDYVSLHTYLQYICSFLSKVT